MSARASSMTMIEEKERVPCLTTTSTQAQEVRGEGDGERTGGARRRWEVDVLMALWGLGGWVGVNALYVQLPLLVERAPERWALPAHMALAVQAANAGPLLHAAARRLRAAPADAALIPCLLLGGATALLLNAWLHPVVLLVGGSQRSLPFLALTWCAALVGCTSSVLFYPYLRHFRDLYLTTYLLGEGLSGLLPSLLALAQGVGGEPRCEGGWPVYPPARFSSAAFLCAIGGLVAASGGAFLALDNLRTFDTERVAERVVAKGEEAAPPVSLRSRRWLSLLVLNAALNALANGVLPAVQSYACMPHGARAYHLAAALGAAAAPAACLLGVWLRPVPGRALTALLTVVACGAGLVLAMALSPRPLLGAADASGAGAGLAVTLWVVVVSLLAYCRMWVMVRARDGGARAMRAVGATTQTGSAVGSALMFLLINYTALFTQPALCPPLLPAPAAANNTMLHS